MKRFAGPSICLLSLILVFSACASSVAAQAGNQPDWVRDPYAKYDRQANVAAVGMGSSREAAEKSALGNLVAIFGQRIQVDERVSVSYQEALRSGAAASWSETTDISSNIAIAAGMESLVGAEIGETWRSNNGEHYALAFLNKARATQLYSGMIRSNQAMINNLVTMPPTERNTLEGFARYQLAADIADVTVSYGNLLSVIDVTVQGLRRGDDYRLEAVNITRAIPVGLNVQNDRAGRIQGAFAKALSDIGFHSGGTNSRYMLDVNVVTEPVTIAGNPYNQTRIGISANLKDANSGTVLLPFDFTTRVGHTSQAEADNRAYLEAERRINNEYANLLSAYLSQLMPKR